MSCPRTRSRFVYRRDEEMQRGQIAGSVKGEDVTYYTDRLETLRDLFGTAAVSLEPGHLVVHGHRYPIVDDVIILLSPSEYSRRLAERMGMGRVRDTTRPEILSSEIQYTFGEEWTAFPEILREHESEFHQYVDLLDLPALAPQRICDLGCGIGRWSFFLSTLCRELVLVDFSDAIFVARRNLAGARNAFFFMGDLTRLPFREGFADLLICLGVLHHLPTPALKELRALGRYSPQLLVYLYYALDNRPAYFRLVLGIVTRLRAALSTTIYDPHVRRGLTWLLTAGLYVPLIALGKAVNALGGGRYVPLYETYAGKSLRRIRQDVYDRFFTPTEQRHRRDEILALTDTFSQVIVSDRHPYWHFVCLR